MDGMRGNASWLMAEETTTSSPANDSSELTECNSDNVHYFLHSSFAVAVVIIIAMSFMNRRHRHNTECCDARPGLSVPINLLDDFDNRWSYACSFGAITNTIVVIFLGPEYFGFQAPQVAKVFVGMVTAIEVCIIYFPLFACINTHHVTSGSMIGFIYASVWLYASIKQLVNCTMDPIPELLPYAGLVLSIPNMICLTGVAVRFLYNFIRAIIDKAPIKEEFKQNIAEVWQINYVKGRLNWKERPDGSERCQKLLKFIKKYIYERNSQFKFSSRVICSLFVVICCTYQMGLLYMVSNAYFSQWAMNQVNRYVNISGLPRNDTTVENLYTSVTMLNISWIVATGIALALFAINVIFIVFKYRRDTLKLFRGKKEFIPLSVQKQDSSLFVRNCMLFAGFQIAYMIWGYFVLNFVLWLVALLFCLLIVLPLMNGITDIVRFFANFCIVPLVVSVTLRAIQTVISGKFFLQDKIEKDDKYKPLALDNRRVFHLTNYFFFIANIETGLFSCLYRIIQGLIFGLVFLGRLDRCVLMAGLESQDIGYNAYLGMLYTEHTHNNPILRVFCHILLESIKEKKAADLEIKRKCRDDKKTDSQTEVKEYENLVMEEDLIDLAAQKDAETSAIVKELIVNSSAKETTDYLEMEEGIRPAVDKTSKSEGEVVESDVEQAPDKDPECKEGSERIADDNDDDDNNEEDTTFKEDVDEQDKQTDKSFLARHRWKILLTLVNNPHLVAYRKIKPEKKEKKKKKKGAKKTEPGFASITQIKFEQYRKLKEEIRELEIQIFGPYFKRQLVSIACQASEDIHVDCEVPNVSTRKKDENGLGNNCISRQGSNKINTEIDNTNKNKNTHFPFSNGNRLKALSWSGMKTEFSSEYTDSEHLDLRASSGPCLSTDFNTDTWDDDDFISLYNF